MSATALYLWHHHVVWICFIKDWYLLSNMFLLLSAFDVGNWYVLSCDNCYGLCVNDMHLQDLDDMEDDILGSLSTKKKNSARQPLSKTLPSKSSLSAGSSGQSAPKSSALKKDTFNINDILADDGKDFDSILSGRCFQWQKMLMLLSSG